MYMYIFCLAVIYVFANELTNLSATTTCIKSPYITNTYTCYIWTGVITVLIKVLLSQAVTADYSAIPEKYGGSSHKSALCGIFL